MISPHIRDSVWVWTQVTSNYDERLPSSRHFEFEVLSQSKSFAPWNGDKQAISTSTLLDGGQELQITARLKAFPEIQFAQNCPFIKDSVAPTVNLKSNTLYYRNMSPDIIQLLPAETMNMEISDANPVSLQACWRSIDDSLPCELKPTAKGALKAPSSGNWTLFIQAKDQAGNFSNTLWPVVIYEKDKLSAVIQTALSAQFLAESNRWLDGLMLMTQVASDWAKTPNTEDLSDIEAQIRASFVRLFFDQKPTLIQFDNKESVEYLGDHLFFYTSSQKYPDMETLQLEIHDFSTRPSAVRKYKIKRSLNQGQPKILHVSDESKFILVRINTTTWKLLDLDFKEVKTFDVPRFGLQNTIQTTMIFADQEQTFQGDIQFTPDSVYALEDGLNSSQVRVWSPLRYLYEKNAKTPTSVMQPEQSYFSADGKILVKIADAMSIVDLSSGKTLDQLIAAIELTGLPEKALASPK